MDCDSKLAEKLTRKARPEVLAPAGDHAALEAAVRAGADAVYFGLQGFNARARATNFNAADLGATMRYLHEHSAKGYVALNTLVFDVELEAVEQTVRTCADAGVDAIIVQDLGAARLARAIAPELPLHASTQMTCTDAASVQFAASLGASRVVLARELSLEDICAIRAETDMELEVFVHGALCIAYSGQCLTSEAIGGRSANRGACAQACRLPYELIVDGAVRDLGERAYLLSPEDLEATALIPALIRIGIACVKIEGRLKGPEYVAATVALYRRAIDAALEQAPSPSDDDRSLALQMYSRGSGPGFLQGVDHQRLVEGRACDHRGLLVGVCSGVQSVRGKRCVAVRVEHDIACGDGILIEGGYAGEGEIGGRVWALTVCGVDVDHAGLGDEALVWLGPKKPVPDNVSPKRRVWKTNDPSRARQVLKNLEHRPFRATLDVRVSAAKFGEHPVFEARSERGGFARVQGDCPVEHAQKIGGTATAKMLHDKLSRLGETPFALGALEVDLPEGSLLAVSSVNRARRALVDALIASAQHQHTTRAISHRELLRSACVPEREPPLPGLFVLCRNLGQAQAAIDAGVDGIYLDFLELTGTGHALRALRSRGEPVHITLAPPRIRKPGEEKIDKYLRELAPNALLVRGLGALYESAAEGIPRIGDFSLNVTNKLAAAEVLGRGLAVFTPSFDLDAAQLKTLLDSPFAPFAELVVHHPMPLFHMEHCVFAALLSDGNDYKTCGRPCDRHQVSLRDRAGVCHPLEADVGCRNTVFHAAAQSAAGLIADMQHCGVRRFRIELVREQPDEVARIVSAYRRLLSGAINAVSLRHELKTTSAYGIVRGTLRVLNNE